MNIKDIDLDWDKVYEEYIGPSRMGALQAVFARQRELMDKYHHIEAANFAQVPQPGEHGQIDNRIVQMRIKDMAYRTVEELSEATNCLKNKPWKNDMVLTDRDHFYEELADAFHFFVELCIVAGLEAEDLFNLYFMKSEVNKFRQRSNY